MNAIIRQGNCIEAAIRKSVCQLKECKQICVDAAKTCCKKSDAPPDSEQGRMSGKLTSRAEMKKWSPVEFPANHKLPNHVMLRVYVNRTYLAHPVNLAFPECNTLVCPTIDRSICESSSHLRWYWQRIACPFRQAPAQNEISAAFPAVERSD